MSDTNVTEDHSSDNSTESSNNNVQQNTDDNKIYNSEQEENGSSRGHVSVEEHLENVDVTEEKINQMTKEHSSEYSFENVGNTSVYD